MRDFTSWPKQWNDAAMRRIAERLERPRSGWPLVGMLALGLVAGAALAGYAVSQRAQIKRLSMSALGMGDGLDDLDDLDTPEVENTVPRSNHRRKATSEV